MLGFGGGTKQGQVRESTGVQLPDWAGNTAQCHAFICVDLLRKNTAAHAKFPSAEQTVNFERKREGKQQQKTGLAARQEGTWLGGRGMGRTKCHSASASWVVFILLYYDHLV